MLMLNVPATVGLMVLAAPIVRVIFERGAFTPPTPLATAAALQFYAIGLLGYSVVRIASPTFYALGQNRTPVMVSIATVLVNAALNIVLVRVDGLPRAGARHVDRRALQRRRCCWSCCAASLGGLEGGACAGVARPHRRSRRRRWARRPARSMRGCRRCCPATRSCRRSIRLGAAIGAALVVLAPRRTCCASASSDAGVALVTRRFVDESADDASVRSGCTRRSCCWRARTSSSTATATSYAPLLPLLIPQLNLSLAAAGTLQMCFQMANSVSQLGFGHLADRWRPRVLLIAGPFVAVSDAVAHRPGAERRGCWPPCWSSAGSAARRSIRRRRRWSTGWPAIARGWRCRFTSPAARSGLSLGAAALRAVRRAVRPAVDAAADAAGARRCSRCSCGSVPPIERLQERHEAGGFRALRPYAKPLTLLYLIVVLRTLTALSFSTFMPVMLTRRGMSVAEAGTAVAAYLFASSVGGFLGGPLADRLGRAARDHAVAGAGGAVPGRRADARRLDVRGRAVASAASCCSPRCRSTSPLAR